MLRREALRRRQAPARRGRPIRDRDGGPPHTQTAAKGRGGHPGSSGRAVDRAGPARHAGVFGLRPRRRRSRSRRRRRPASRRTTRARARRVAPWEPFAWVRGPGGWGRGEVESAGAPHRAPTVPLKRLATPVAPERRGTRPPPTARLDAGLRSRGPWAHEDGSGAKKAPGRGSERWRSGPPGPEPVVAVATAGSEKVWPAASSASPASSWS